MTTSYEEMFAAREHNSQERLFWPGTEEGIPYKGQHIPNLKQDEYDQLVRVGTTSTRILDMSKQEDINLYNSVVDSAAKGRAAIRKELIKEHEGSWLILLQWLDFHVELPRNFDYLRNGV